MDRILNSASATEEAQTRSSADSDWWRGAVIYQIYPRSYQDSDGDGVGDLRGIASRLPYIADLGVDAIWISPFFKSPMKDFGYDISDYRDIAPEFGTLEDFRSLLGEAHALGLKVMLDLALSHTSDKHEWFKESRSSRSNGKSDWYVWADPAPDGLPPNNWLSVFGGPAWSWDSVRRQYYLHNFLNSQPDLNYHNPEVQDAVLDTVAYWLGMGVDGFRLDTINFYFCDAELRSNPALPSGDRNDSIAPNVNPYNHQLHVYDKNRPENLRFLRRFREVMDRHGATVAMGEVGDAQRGLELMGEYTAGGSLIHTCYSFEFLSGPRPTAEGIAATLGRFADAAPDGWASWAFSNHDVMRHASRWELDGSSAKLFATLLMCLRGSACVYQGEEIGLSEAELKFEDLQDPYGKEFWPEFKGRDGCRTPMVWDSALSNGGFTGGEPWLPVPADHIPRSVSEQAPDSDSLLSHYKAAIALRREFPELRVGSLAGVSSDGPVLTFERQGSRTLFCAFNLGDGPAEVRMPDGDWECAFGPGRGRKCAGAVELSGWESLVAINR